MFCRVGIVKFCRVGIFVLSVTLCLVILYPLYKANIKWYKKNEVDYRALNLQSRNDNDSIVVGSYFSTEEIKRTVDTLLQTSKRVEPYFVSARQYRSDDKFTIVMLTYKRTATLLIVFDHYCEMPEIIDQILVIWNNIGEPVPQELLNYPCKFPVTFLEQKENKLINRFLPYPEIRTKCVFSLDDDRLVSRKSLQLGFRMWKKFPHMLVGYVARAHGYDELRKRSYYRRTALLSGEKYSLIITGSAFLHINYLYIYTNSAPHEIIEFVNKYQNCEDITMAVVMTMYLENIDKPQCTCLWIKEEMTELKEPGLSDDKSHYEERDNCLNMLMNVYGKMPLQYCYVYVKHFNF